MAVRPQRLSPAELSRRARLVRLVLTDSDGVLTDAGVYYSDSGEAMKRFSIRDGMGVERLRNAGVETAIITGELSGSVKQRAAKLHMKHFYPGVKDKYAALEQILQETALTTESIAYIGDDVNDLGIIAAVRAKGLTGAPADALPEVLRAVHYRCSAPGGHGAFREFAEWLLRLRA
jgi:3-deoxy-D-manno-octulosonate 8-phosphate phosphatase (KDO 8-P phosphatase)